MEKRYQVFVSSTFLDLLEERQAVLKAILELNHMPAGMELFPPTDETAWQLIRDVIDGSDYYVLIVGGRYGSLDKAGLSYTEKEYDYAVATKKPVIALLHKKPSGLPREKTETEPTAWEKLQKFRTKVELKHTCVYWQSADDLKSKVILGMTAAVKRHPTVGWVRADKVPAEATVANVLALKSRIAELEQEVTASREQPPPGTENLAQGEDQFQLHLSFTSRPRSYPYGDEVQEYHSSIAPSWNAIFAAVAPAMINEATNASLHRAFRGFFTRESLKAFQGRKDFKDHTLHDFSFQGDEIETCIVQLRALGLIKENDRKRSVKDTGTYWALTPYGNTLMVQLRAIRRDSNDEEVLGGEATESNETDDANPSF